MTGEVDILEFQDGLKDALKINENSVIVDLTIMDNFEFELPEKTVVNHKRYTIISNEDNN